MKEAEVWIRVYEAAIGGAVANSDYRDKSYVAAFCADAAVKSAKERGYIVEDKPRDPA